MNLILTKECAKKCSFCFTGDYSKNTEMSLTLIETIIKRFNNNITFKLLGGEPTQHSQFLKILNLLNKYNTTYLIVSNLLFSKDILLGIKSLHNKKEEILVNGMELNKKNRIKIFSKNWRNLKNEKIITRLALTISKNSTIEFFDNYIKFLKKHLKDIPHIRIGLDLNGKYLINNTNIGNIIFHIQKLLPRTTINFDCQIPFCIFTKNITGDYINLHSICHAPAIDIFYDESVIYCYQFNHIKISNILDYNSSQELVIDLLIKYKKKEKINKIDKRCEICIYYLTNQCNSLCLGCYQNDKQYIDIKNNT